jgi:hypothetical protein
MEDRLALDQTQSSAITRFRKQNFQDIFCRGTKLFLHGIDAKDYFGA